MALLAEELVEEWLNRQGYFTIRGLKLGVHEMDLLAVRPRPDGTLDCRHIEVQASMRPVSYITQVTKDQQKHGISRNSAKERSDADLRAGIAEWIEKKFDHREKARLRGRLAQGVWSRELVVNVVKHKLEIELIQALGISVLYLPAILAEMTNSDRPVEAAAGAHLLDLVSMARPLSGS